MGTLDAIYEEWATAMRRRKLAVGTIQRRRYELRSWEAVVGYRWREATRADVERWLDTRTLGARAQYSAISHLTAFYKWARREALTDANPCELVDRPRLPHRLPRPARAPAVARAIGMGRSPSEVGCALAAWAGLRCCEIARLTWNDVDLVAGELWVTGKGDKDGVVPICRQLQALLAALDGTAGPVIGRKMNPNRVSVMLNAHLRAVGADCTAHQLRHAFGTRLLKTSGSIVVVQHALRHASVATTQIYAEMDPDAVAAAIAAW